jgi:hypothetical protein
MCVGDFNPLSHKKFRKFLWGIEGGVHGVNFGLIFNNTTFVPISTNKQQFLHPIGGGISH